MAEFASAIPWMALLVVFVGMGLLHWRVISALDHALLRSQQDPTRAPAASSRGRPSQNRRWC
jgi:hypothetical protein